MLDNKKRLQYIDIIKGVAIILVVLAHLIQTNVVDGVHDEVFQFINSFHMPLFFFASGYIAVKTCRLDDIRGGYLFVNNKLRSLILPLLIWTLFVNRYFLSSSWTSLTIEDLIVCLTKPGLWFLLTLFKISILFGVLHLISKRLRNRWYIDSILFVVSVGLLIWLKQMSEALYFIFYSIGVFVAKYHRVERICQSPKVIAVATISFFILITHWQIGGTYIDDILKLIIVPCAFVLFLHFSKIAESSRVGGWLSTIGQHSLAVYIIHWNFLKIIDDYQIPEDMMNPFWLFLMMWLIAVIITYVVVVISKAISFNKYLSFLLLGKRIRKDYKV